MDINKSLPAKSISYGSTRKASAIKYLVYHYTGNATDTAKANARYFSAAGDNQRSAGAHYFVDRTSIYQSIDDLKNAYAVGKFFTKNNGAGKMWGKVTNKNSISIEMCSNNSVIDEKTIQNAVWLGKMLMAKYNIPIENVYRHWDVCGKECPGWSGWIGSNDSKWKDLKSRLIVAESSTRLVGYQGAFPSLPTRGYFKSGDEGTEVKRLQMFLNWYGGYGLKVDGILGNKTIEAVKKFQTTEKLTADGLFGKKSLERAKSVRKEV